jgi:hypothetical protein
MLSRPCFRKYFHLLIHALSHLLIVLVRFFSPFLNSFYYNDVFLCTNFSRLLKVDYKLYKLLKEKKKTTVFLMQIVIVVIIELIYIKLDNME